jgi:hypothetical protein
MSGADAVNRGRMYLPVDDDGIAGRLVPISAALLVATAAVTNKRIPINYHWTEEEPRLRVEPPDSRAQLFITTVVFPYRRRKKSKGLLGRIRGRRDGGK